MINMRVSAKIVVLGALALSACGSEESGSFTGDNGESGEYRIDEESGEASMTVQTPDGDVTMRAGTALPIDLPAGFTLIDGAQVTSNTVIDRGEERGALVIFTSDKTPKQITDFYRAQAEAAGIAIQIETNINGGSMIGGENEEAGVTFSITAYPGEDGTTGQLTIGQDLN